MPVPADPSISPGADASAVASPPAAVSPPAAAGPDDASFQPAEPTPAMWEAWLPQYEFAERLESNSFGVTFKARHPGLERQVLIRVFAELAPERVAALTAQMRKAARIVHPNVTAIFDFGELPNGALYLVTEHVTGRPLAECLQSGRLTKPQAYQLALDLCAGLQAVHEQGLADGNLSSGTLRVTPDWQMKLAGIGLSASHSGGGEWLEASREAVAADLQALGGVLHEMFAGDRPEPNGRVSRNLPPAFARLLMRCLETDPGRRFERAADVRAALLQALQSERQRAATVKAPPAPAPAGAANPPSVHAAPAPGPPPAARPPVAYVPPPRRPVADFIRWVDRMLWTTLSVGLHVSILTGAVLLLIGMFVLKDRIVIETVPASKTAPPVPAVRTPRAPTVQEPMGLGPLPPAPLLPAPRAAEPAVGFGPPAPGAKAALDAHFLNAVQREMDLAAKASRLNDLPYLQREMERLRSGQAVPAQDEPGLPASLQRLRDTYRRELGKLTGAKK